MRYRVEGTKARWIPYSASVRIEIRLDSGHEGWIENDRHISHATPDRSGRSGRAYSDRRDSDETHLGQRAQSEHHQRREVQRAKCHAVRRLPSTAQATHARMTRTTITRHLTDRRRRTIQRERMAALAVGENRAHAGPHRKGQGLHCGKAA